MALDILVDTRETLVRYGLPEDVVVAAIRELRLRWGSQEVYVQAIDREMRDKAARAALMAGESIEVAAKKAGCSTSTIRRRASRWL